MPFGAVKLALWLREVVVEAEMLAVRVGVPLQMQTPFAVEPQATRQQRLAQGVFVSDELNVGVVESEMERLTVAEGVNVLDTDRPPVCEGEALSESVALADGEPLPLASPLAGGVAERPGVDEELVVMLRETLKLALGLPKVVVEAE